jgi:hypothetical protein
MTLVKFRNTRAHVIALRRRKIAKTFFLIVDFMSWQLTRRSDTQWSICCVYLKAKSYASLLFFDMLKRKKYFSSSFHSMAQKVCLLSPLRHISSSHTPLPPCYCSHSRLIAPGSEMETKKFFISFLRFFRIQRKYAFIFYHRFDVK